jgi:multiple sugar transport system permease protein
VGRRPLWLLAPALLLLCVLIGIPLALAFYTSFLNLTLSTLHEWLSAPFVGLTNFVDAVTGEGLLGDTLWRSALASVEFCVLTTAITLPIGILAALTVNSKIRGRSLYRSLYLIPYVIPTFVTAFVARIAFQNGSGVVDVVLSDLHLASRNTYWLLGANSFWAMLIVEVWSTWPFMYIMVLAGLQGIPSEIYDACDVDGATTFQKLWRVVLPQLRRIIGLAVLLSTIFHFNNFTLPFVMFGTTPPGAVDVLPLNVYITSFNVYQFGLGAAMSVVTMAVMIVPGVIYMRSLRLTEVEQ